ncbi:DoxX family protein [Rhodomicrobium vannielii ATCC 17100]|uniref:DoxX family protein n=1 Tax=Rhodomicrobium vannielii TaxID=1069 RepID=UPI00191B18C2|nr:DoxX family protein [Rhodomicrobium vannielii]MBJ7533826.1 DoxX family protein [Rhodomicrobium vannielii ATCC 17100]
MTSINYMAAIGRIMMALIFIAYGFFHLLTKDETIARFVSISMIEPTIVYYIATSIEIFGGIFLALGLGTRYAALILAFYTLAAAIGFHSNLADSNQLQHFMKNIALAGGLIQVFAFGSGGLALTHSRPR